MDTIILGILRDTDSCDYDILKLSSKKGNAELDINDAPDCNAFRKMEKETLITTYWGGENSGARRQYYSITEIGSENYTANVIEWTRLTVY